MNNIPASHKSHELILPEVLGELMNSSENQKATIPVFNKIVESIENSDVNLVIILGGFGSGKSSIFKKLHSKFDHSVKINYDEIVTLNKGNSIEAINDYEIPDEKNIVIIDNFDSVNSMQGYQTSPPDLRHLIKLAQTNKKVILATRRSIFDSQDQFIQQISSEIRISKFGFNNPVLIKTVSWPINFLKTFFDQTTNESVRKVIDFLETNETLEYLRKPLLFKMLLKIANNLKGIEKNKVLSQIFTMYSEDGLSVDFDEQRSRLSSNNKKRILSELAFDIFSGKGEQDHLTNKSLSLEIDRISERVMEEVTRDSNILLNHEALKYNWTEDFITTNHLFNLKNSNTTNLFKESRYEFIHQSFYEYFVAISMLRKIFNAINLEFNVNSITSETFNSLILEFIKELGGKNLIEHLKFNVANKGITVMDRLFYLYFLEDEIDFKEIINSSPASYFKKIKTYSNQVNNFFLKKMLWYQLIIKGQYKARDYIKNLRKHETPIDIAGEFRLHSIDKNVVEQLINRLENPSLKNAIEITIYRLGQLGDSSTIEVLEKINDENYDDLVQEAIQTIKNRQ